MPDPILYVDAFYVSPYAFSCFVALREKAYRSRRGSCPCKTRRSNGPVLGFMLHRLILNGDPVPPRVRAYAEAQWQRPAVREWVEQRRIPLVPYEG